jgi:hypothetical protein
MTDDQFIEKIRRDVARNRTFWIWTAVLSHIGLVATFWLAYGYLHGLIETGQSSIHRGLILGFVAGAIFSFMVFMLAIHSGLSLAMVLGKAYPVRMMKLLLKYHDQAKTDQADISGL